MRRHLASIIAWGLLAMGFSVSQAYSQAIATYAGSYEGVSYTSGVIGSEPYPYGKIEFTLAVTGKATVKVTLKDKKTYSFVTNFTAGQGVATAPARTLYQNTKLGSVTLGQIQLTPTGAFSVSGVSTVAASAGSYAVENAGSKLVAFTGKAPSIPAWSGAYTMAMTPIEGSGSEVPGGAGYATVTVSTKGVLTYVGKLGDGTKLTGTAKPDADAKYRLFTTVYLTGGFFVTELDMDSLGFQEELAVWNKPTNLKDTKYKAGFTAALDVQVRRWTVPAKGAYPVAGNLGFGNSKNFTVEFSDDGLGDGDYSATLPDTLRITSAGVLQAVAGAVGSPVENNSKAWNTNWSVKLNRANGSFTGSVFLRHTILVKGKPKIVTRKVPVDGVMLLGSTLGSEPFALGQYRVIPKAVGSTEVAGLVQFRGPLEDNKAVATAGTYVTVGLLAMPDASKPLTSAKPLLPQKLPTLTYGVSVDNASQRIAYGKFTLTVAEDLQSVKVNGIQLNYLSKTGNIHVYQSVVGGIFRVLNLEINEVAGGVTGYILSCQQFMPGRVAAFTCDPNGPDNNAERYTSITKL